MIISAKKFSLFGVLCALCSAVVMQSQAAGLVQPNPTPTARPSIIAPTASRMPTLRVNESATGTGGSNYVSTTDKECIDNYLECVKEPEVCGPNFEECTTKNLFFAKKNSCTSTLLACPSGGVNQLFGTTNSGALATKSTTIKDENGEFVYVYPTDNSILGSMIVGAAITQRFSTQDCIRRYTTCLKRDDVCGNDFELCTSNTEFKRQKVFCESTLARCQAEGKTDLFGSTNTSNNPTSDSRLGILITEGAALAAVNAVATCYKVADQCILQACGRNPYKCKEGTDRELVSRVEELVTDETGAVTGSTITNTYGDGAVNRNDILALIRNACLDTIGGSKYCYATVRGNMPTQSQLLDHENRDEIFADLYSSRFNTSLKAKIDELIEQFDKKTKQRCQETIVSCAMRSCGEGSGPACYAAAYDPATKLVDIMRDVNNIRAGCKYIVDNDTACRYAAATFQPATGALLFSDESLFDMLFTSPGDISAAKPDAVGAVAVLNTRLSTAYSQSALDGMRRQCQNFAQNCVRSMCGTEFEMCYRNRTDVGSSIGATNPDGNVSRAGGVLDRAVVIGLCLSTVKNNPTCEEHIKAEAARRSVGTGTDFFGNTMNSWGGATTARAGWIGAATDSYSLRDITGASQMVQKTDDSGEPLCRNYDGAEAPCGTAGYTDPVMIDGQGYALDQIARTIFQELIQDLEAEAQAKYMARLVKQQNVCMSAMSGGILGTGDLSGTFQWARLRSQRVPAGYAVSGLSSNQFQVSNELYGSFCLARVTLQSDDRRIQDAITSGRLMRNAAAAYFAVGDAFTCGAWIPQSALEEISESVKEEYKEAKGGPGIMSQLLGGALGAVGGGVGGNWLANNKGLGGLLGTSKPVSLEKAKECEQAVNDYIRVLERGNDTVQVSSPDCIDNAKSIVKTGTEKIQLILGVSTVELTKANNAIEKTNCQQIKDSINEAKHVAVMVRNSCKQQTETDDKRKSMITLAGVGAGALGGILVARSISNSARDSAASKEAQEWMDNIGRHIRCYVGGTELGFFGDVISIDVE